MASKSYLFDQRFIAVIPHAESEDSEVVIAFLVAVAANQIDNPIFVINLAVSEQKDSVLHPTHHVVCN